MGKCLEDAGGCCPLLINILWLVSNIFHKLLLFVHIISVTSYTEFLFTCFLELAAAKLMIFLNNFLLRINETSIDDISS